MEIAKDWMKATHIEKNNLFLSLTNANVSPRNNGADAFQKMLYHTPYDPVNSTPVHCPVLDRSEDVRDIWSALTVHMWKNIKQIQQLYKGAGKSWM